MMNIGLAQINATVGDLEGNARRIVEACRLLEAQESEIILTPELVLTGYPPQDLLFQSDFVPKSLQALEEIHKSVG
jgi:predicted amidohydrolase